MPTSIQRQTQTNPQAAGGSADIASLAKQAYAGKAGIDNEVNSMKAQAASGGLGAVHVPVKTLEHLKSQLAVLMDGAKDMQRKLGNQGADTNKLSVKAKNTGVDTKGKSMQVQIGSTETVQLGDRVEVIQIGPRGNVQSESVEGSMTSTATTRTPEEENPQEAGVSRTSSGHAPGGSDPTSEMQVTLNKMLSQLQEMQQQLAQLMGHPGQKKGAVASTLNGEFKVIV